MKLISQNFCGAKQTSKIRQTLTLLNPAAKYTFTTFRKVHAEIVIN